MENVPSCSSSKMTSMESQGNCEQSLTSVLAEISLEDSEGRCGTRKVVRKLLFDNEDKENAIPRDESGECEELSLSCSGHHDPMLHVEVAISQYSSCNPDAVESHVRAYLIRNVAAIPTTSAGHVTITDLSHADDDFVRNNVVHIHISDIDRLNVGQEECVSLKDVSLVVHVYKYNEGSGDEYIEGSDEREAHLSAATTTLLPNIQLAGLWDSLVFDSDVKERLVNYAVTSLYFSKCNVDPNMVSCNRLILLHGPPGTGKTTLARALAQKLSIRLSRRYPYCHLVEINSHSLFSKWFSESGKLVGKLFDKIHEILADGDSLTFVLVDEVESLTAARRCVSGGGDPSDAMRVVNAVLTRVDRLRHHPNVLVLATSNMSDAIDDAFLDRADLTQYIGLPGSAAIYGIYCSAIDELMTRGIIAPTVQLLPYKEVKMLGKPGAADDDDEDDDSDTASRVYSGELQALAEGSVGFSGRSLRKLPFLCHALYIHTTASVTLQLYLYALSKTIKYQRASRAHNQPAAQIQC